MGKTHSPQGAWGILAKGDSGLGGVLGGGRCALTRC